MSGGGGGGGTVAVRGSGAECRKFAPNIFNKSKCSSCFKQKEEHSAEALECNRATRKISKCGYLFVAPGWDFSNPLNRTKRWQRRWFVLYDDGELTYSVDEHPETVPQARIDMTRVLEVAAAEDVTGHPYSLAVTSPEGVTFVKGTCREETRWWVDVLQMYSRNKGRHKRNATFPGGQTTILQVTPTIRSNTPNPQRPRFNSCRSEPRNGNANWLSESEDNQELISGGYGTGPSLTNGNASGSGKPEDAEQPKTIDNKPPMVPIVHANDNNRVSYRDQPASSASPPTRDKLRAEDKARRRIVHQNERAASMGVATVTEKLDDDACRRILMEHEREREGKLRDIAASLTQPRVRRAKPRAAEPTRDVVDAASQQDKLVRGDPDGCGLDISGIRYSPTSELRVDLPAEDVLNIKKGWLMKQGLNKEWNKHWFVLRGCGLMYYRDPCAEDKGIMDGVIDLNTVTAVTPLQVARNYGFQTVTWNDKGTTVLSAVTAGIRSSWMAAIRKAANLPDLEKSHDGCRDPRQDSSIDPQSPTASITDRDSNSVAPSTSVTPRSVLFSSDEEYRTASEGGRRESGDWSELPVSPPLVRTDNDWPVGTKGSNWSDSTSHEWSELPPSPPLTRTPLSRVKARSRSSSSSRSRVYKRSRSSPPSSRRSTLDSVRTEDLMMACCEHGEDQEESESHPQSNGCLPTTNENPLIELLENRVTLLRDQLDQNQTHPSALLVIVERQENEIESLKAQLSTTRDEVVNAEKELSRLRQQRAEATARETQLEELIDSMRRTEQQRAQDVDDLEKMKKIYLRDKELLERKLMETEAILRETTERCELLTEELASSHRTVEHLRVEMTSLSDRLSQGIEENERLYNRVRELEGKSSLTASRERGRSFDSLSDLTNIDLDLDLHALDKERIMDEYEELRGRFEKAILEIRAMRKELREAHAAQDALELQIIAHKQDAASVGESNQAQVQLMAARIQDLTTKLANSEKQARLLKQKLTKTDTRDKRRSLSLKGRESFQISQEMEDKLLDLESKISAIERGRSSSAPVSAGSSSKESSPNPKKEKKRETKIVDRPRPRRKSLDSATCSEPMKVLIRLSTLESKVANATESFNSDVEKDSSECSEVSVSSVNEISLEILSRLKKYERAIGRSKRRLDKCLGSTQAEEKAEKCLREVSDILDSCLECKKNQANSRVMESVGVVVSRLESMLRDKLSELTERRQILSENGQLDDREKLKLLAERIAFESVILKQIKYAVGRTFDRSAVLGELVETSQLVASLKRKIHGTKPKTYQNSSYIQYLTKALANRLVLAAGVSTPEMSKEIQVARGESLQFLLQKQKEVNEMMHRYKEMKLIQLAEALASETLSLSDQDDFGKQVPISSKKLLEDRRIREAWALAQETVSKELIQAEVSHVIIRCGQLYEQNITSITDMCLNFETDNGVSLESWTDEAQMRLRHEMELCIQELSEAYEECLRTMKLYKNKSLLMNVEYESRELLVDYADVIAHKALIDARISLLRETNTQPTLFTGETFVSSLIRNEDILSSITIDDENNPLLEAEFYFLYQQFSKECEDSVAMVKRGATKEQMKMVNQSFADLEEDLSDLGKCFVDRGCDSIVENDDWPRTTVSINDWSSVCEKCSQLREQIRKLNDYFKSITCNQCDQLHDTVRRLTNEHNQELDALKHNQEQSLMEIRTELDNQRMALTNQYEQEAASLRDRARKLEHRLNAIDSEHSAHVNELRAAYQRSISAELDTDAETRKRYKEEIKQLRGLCEKGLLAMENSHRRIIAEMEEKHRQELESLRLEKEQALSEETQATLAALDAMRKAHEHEVQKEIAKFKQEFVKQCQAREDVGTLHKEHEEEMEEIKQEILSLSSKYSSKCVESAALEEKVGTLSKQLAQAQQHIMQLDVRNRQLRAHLMLETNDSTISDTIQLLRGRDSEIAEQREEIHRLQQQLKNESERETPSKVAAPMKTPLSLTYTPAYANQRSRLSQGSSSNGTNDEDRPKSTFGSRLQKSFSADKPASTFSYKLERIKSVSLPYANNIIGKSNGIQQTNEKKDTSQETTSALWDCLKPRTGLPHQYQGNSTEVRVKCSSINRSKKIEQDESKQQQQQQQQQHQEAYGRRNISRRPSGLTTEPATLSVAELTRSPTVRWSSRSCTVPSSVSTAASSYLPLHTPQPAVGMVAERKKRFEL